MKHPKDYIEAMQWAIDGKLEHLTNVTLPDKGLQAMWRETTKVEVGKPLNHYRHSEPKPLELWIGVRASVKEDGIRAPFFVTHGFDTKETLPELDSPMRAVKMREVLPPLTDAEVEEITAAAIEKAHGKGYPYSLEAAVRGAKALLNILQEKGRL